MHIGSFELAAPEGLEPSTSDLEGPCSIQLSYGAAEVQSAKHSAAFHYIENIFIQ